MNKRRLLKLARMLEADARKKNGIKFNLGTVISTDNYPSDGNVKLNCGTQACAMGLAAISGAFKSAGLSFQVGTFQIETTVRGQFREYGRAAMAIFGLTQHQADFLFSPNSYPDEMSLLGAAAERFVAKRIRNFVKHGKTRSARAAERTAADS